MNLDIAKERAKLYIRNRPSLYYNVYKMRGGFPHLAVNRTTQLVIEGFPRSGNTFSVIAFEHAQQEAVNIAHHLHVPAQVIRAARWRIPSIVLIRKPVDAVISLLIRHPPISAGRALVYYTSFYETVSRYRDAYVLGAFEEVTDNYGAVIERLNAKFGTYFVPFEHTTDNVEKVFSHIENVNARLIGSTEASEESVARPSTVRQEQRSSLEKQLESPKLRKLVNRARLVHARLISSATV